MPRKIEYTNHALRRLKERNIPKMKGADVAGQELIDYIKHLHPFSTENYYSLNKNGGIVYWASKSKLQKGSEIYIYFYVTTYIELGTVLVITAWKCLYEDYKEFLNGYHSNKQRL